METVVVVLMIIVILLLLLKSGDAFASPGFDQDIDAYLINLERRPERLENFKKSYYASELSNNKLIIIKAVDGANLGEIEGYMTEGTQRIITTGKRRDSDELTPGMLGCYLSHYKLYDEFLASGKQYAYVFEDDGKVLPEFKNKFKNAPADWDILMTGVQSCMECPEVNQDFTRAESFYGTGGYIISRAGAEKMKRFREPTITLQIDGFMGKLCKERKVNIYSLKKNLVDTVYMPSDVQMGVS